MELLVILAILGLLLVAACALGQVWGPALLALGFVGWGLLLLTSGLRGPLVLVGLAFIGAGVLEIVAASVLYGERDAHRRRSWQLSSALLGLVGSVSAFASAAYIAAALISALFI